MHPRRISDIFRFRAALVLIVVAWGVLAPQQAQARRKARHRRPEPFQAFKLRELDGWVGAGFKSDEERHKRAEADEWKEIEEAFFEEVSIDTLSSVYHPRFLLIDGRVLIRLEQGEREVTLESVDQGDRDGLINQYDLSLAFLPEHVFNVRLFASRSVSSVDAEYLEDYDVTTERAGTQLRWENKWLPMRVSATTSDSEGEGSDLTDETTHTITYQADQDSENRRTRLEYEWEDEEDRRARSDLTTHKATLFNTVSFGPNDRSRLYNNVQFWDRTGTMERRELYGTADVLLHHRLNFQTNYHYYGRLSETEQEQRVLHDGEAGFRHRLYRNLTTTADLGGQVENGDTGESWESRSHLAFDYIRSIPHGSVTAGATSGFRLRDEDFTTDVGEVLDEHHTFGASNIVRLGNELVDTLTIVVTDADNSKIYVEGLDYSVQAFGTFTEIVRLIGGTIPDGGTVLVDYRYNRSRDRRFYTIDREVRFGLNLFSALRLYTTFYRFDRHLIEGYEVGGEDDTADWISGVSFNRWGVHFRVEHEDHDSEITPHLTDRVGGGVDLRLPLRGVFSVSGSWYHTDYPNTKFLSSDPDVKDFTEVETYQARLSLNPLRRLSVEGGLYFRDEDGRVNSEETVFYGELFWRIRQIEVIIRAERRQEEDRTGAGDVIVDKRDRDFFQFEIIRRF